MLARLLPHLERRSVRLALYALLALLLVWPVLGAAALSNEFRDAQVLLLHERAAVDTVLRHGELPLWDPWYCGGIYALGAPQARFLSPTFLVSLLLGPERAEVVVVFAMAVVGMEATYAWLKLRVRDAASAALVAPAFALSGHFAVAFFRGWTNFWGFELVPLVLYGITVAARGRASGVAIASLAFAIVLGFGGTFAAPLVAVAAILEGLRALLEARGPARARAAGMLVLTASFMAALAFVRLMPVADTLEAGPRIMAGTPGHLPRHLFFALAGKLDVKDGDVALLGSFYVGVAFLTLVMLGGADKKSLPAYLVMLVLLWLAAGYFRKPALFALLREVPSLAALRYPERFLWLLVLFACEPAARTLERLPRFAASPPSRAMVHAVLVAAALFTLVNEVRAFHRVAEARLLRPILTADRPRETFRQARGNRWLAAHYEAQNLGSLSCWEVHPVVESPKLRGDLAQEEYLADPTAGRVERRSFSANRVAVHAELTRASRMYVNQNWHPGWRAEPFPVVNDEGLLAVDLPAGSHDVELRFAPSSARTGAAVSGVGLVAVLALAWLGRRRGGPPTPARRLATVALAVSPWLAFGVAHAGSSDPPWPPHVARNADGTPAVVPALPMDATPLGVAFALPVHLEGARVSGPDALKNVAVDLFLRRTGVLPRSTAVFVHVERRGRDANAGKRAEGEPDDYYNRDHQVVAASFYLSDAPEEAIVEDHVGVHLDDAAAGTWDVFVAFGHVSGRRGRAKVTDARGAAVSEERVKVGSFEVVR